jgi:hypothetical protein
LVEQPVVFHRVDHLAYPDVCPVPAGPLLGHPDPEEGAPRMADEENLALAESPTQVETPKLRILPWFEVAHRLQPVAPADPLIAPNMELKDVKC